MNGRATWFRRRRKKGPRQRNRNQRSGLRAISAQSHHDLRSQYRHVGGRTTADPDLPDLVPRRPVAESRAAAKPPAHLARR